MRGDGARAQVAAAGVREVEPVGRAAAASIAARLSRAGRITSNCDRSGDQVVWTPMLVSTSTSRFTSSIWAMPRSTVRPWLSRAAHIKATAAFFEDRTAIEPRSVVGPSTRKWVGPLGPALINGLSRAVAIRLIISRLRFWPPDSIRWIAL